MACFDDFQVNSAFGVVTTDAVRLNATFVVITYIFNR